MDAESTISSSGRMTARTYDSRPSTLSNTYHQGIVLVNGSLEAEDVVFFDMGSPDMFGGAISATDASITISSCVFEDNIGYDGGAMYAAGSMSLYIEDTRFESNRGFGYTAREVDVEIDEETGEVLSSTVVVQERQGRGGALHVTGTGSINIINSEFIDNRSRWVRAVQWPSEPSMAP